MAEDFSNRIGARKAGVKLHERPSREDIDALLQRHKEHAKRTRPPPKKSFESYLAQSPKAQGGAPAKASAPSGPSSHQEEAGATSRPRGHKRIIKA